MTKEEITRIAREVGFDDGEIETCQLMFEHFAALVASAEREACAEICKKHADVYAKLEQNPTAQSAWAACIDNRDAIRARGQE